MLIRATGQHGSKSKIKAASDFPTALALSRQAYAAHVLHTCYRHEGLPCLFCPFSMNRPLALTQPADSLISKT